jgi:hypothetical protein
MSIIMDTRKTSDQPKSAQGRRGYRFFIKRGLLALAILIVALPLLGFSYETIMAAVDAQSFPPPGKLITVDGHQMHLTALVPAVPQ